MARIEWVKQRLENWALWHARGKGCGLGYATQSILLADPADREREAWVPVDEIEAGVTEEAVEHLKLGFGHLHKTLQLMYLKGCGVQETARQMERSVSTIHAQLERADQLLAMWFTERKRLKDQAAQQLREALDRARPDKLRPPLEVIAPAPPRSTLRLRARARQ